MDMFEPSKRGLRAVGASTGDREVVEWIMGHGKKEGALLERYERFAREASSPVSRYLVKLIIEDERRHHVVMADIAEAIAWGGVKDARPSIPRAHEGSADSQLIAETKKLLASERRDRAELRRLRRRLRSYSGTIWPLLIDLMLRDTQKHTRILRYVVRHRPG